MAPRRRDPDAGEPKEAALECRIKTARLAIQTDTLAEIFIKQGKPEKALAIYGKILGQDPQNEAVRQKFEALQKKIGKKTDSAAREKMIAKLEKWLEKVAPGKENKLLGGMAQIVMTKAGQRLEKLMRRKDLDAILFWGPENIRYLCGFTGSDGALICAREGRVFLTDSRYTEQAKSEVENAVVSQYRQKISGISQALKSLRVRRIGFEAAAVNFDSYRRLQEKLPRVSFIPLARSLRDSGP